MNRRGNGERLREEILEATARLLAETGEERGVTFRAIARATGVAAPSMYAHFAHRDAIIDALVRETFDQLAQVCRDAGTSATSGGQRVRAMCEAYLDFAESHAGQYRILFQRSVRDVTGETYAEGLSAFRLLVDAVEEAAASGESQSADPPADAQLLWVSLHGLAVLPPAMPGFPWRPRASLLDGMLAAIVHLRPA